MHRALILSALLVTAGCGGSDAPAEDGEPQPVAETSGGDTTSPEPEPAAEPAPEPEPEPTGPGQIRVVNVVGGEEVGGEVAVMNEAGEVVAEGASGDTFAVESGSYRVRGHITDDDVLIDTPTTELDGMTTVPAGQTATAQVDFPVSHIIINVRRHGRAIARWRLTVTRQNVDGAEPIVLQPSRTHVPITPGRYSGTLRMGGAQIEVNGLIFQGGARMSVPINVN